jgi:hypothetical protein
MSHGELVVVSDVGEIAVQTPGRARCGDVGRR